MREITFFLLFFCLSFVCIFCTSPQIKQEQRLNEASKADSLKTDLDNKYQPSINELEEKYKDYFSNNKIGESFKVLITKDFYIVKQSRLENVLERIQDDVGDKEQLKVYNELYEKINFINFDIEGILKLKLNPSNGNIESLEYHPYHLPKTKQAMKLFMNDISRYRFKILNNNAFINQIFISIKWIIEKDPTLTPEEAKKRAIEYLKNEKKEK